MIIKTLYFYLNKENPQRCSAAFVGLNITRADMHWLICQNVQVEVFSPDKNSNRLAKDYFYRIDRKLQKKNKN